MRGDPPNRFISQDYEKFLTTVGNTPVRNSSISHGTLLHRTVRQISMGIENV
jgi:hypothetical protein